MIYLIAGNDDEAYEYSVQDMFDRYEAGDTTASTLDYVFVHSIEDFVDRNPDGAFIGTWQERKDVKEIIEYMMSITQQNTIKYRKFQEIWQSLL